MNQNRDGIPPSLAEERRFFPLLRESKTATPAGWNNPERWKTLDEIPESKPFGFAIGGENSNYLLADFDHCMKDGKLIPWAQQVYDRLVAYGDTYIEISVSGTGIHMILNMGDYAEDFPTMTNSPDKLILPISIDEYNKLPESEQKATPKIELFYRTGGRYVYLTGNTEDGTEVATDETAAAMFRELLLMVAESHPEESGSTITSKDPLSPVDDATRSRLIRALDYISPDNYEIWTRVGIALYNSGLDFAAWDAWSKGSGKYHLNGSKVGGIKQPTMEQKWRSFAGSSRWNAGTIFKLAAENPDYSEKEESTSPLFPDDFSDVGEARVFVQVYGDIARYSAATKWIVYNGAYWEESDTKARALVQKLTDRQLSEARQQIKEARKAFDRAIENGSKTDQKAATILVAAAEKYRSFVLSMRKTNRISAILTEAAPSLEIKVEELDSDGFLLNCPSGTVDLRTGQMREHRPEDYITKCCACDPSEEGKELWLDFLDRMTCGDKELSLYHQIISGQEAIGKIFCENLEMQIGTGGNGKSTYNNCKKYVLNDYGGSISAETLTVNCRKNKSPEFAELRGKRFVIASELEENQRLDTAIMKKLCSTDDIYAEKKYKDPFSFRPSHTICLFTNHLPRIGTSDSGTWNRIIVMPFKADFRGQAGEVKNYAEYLFTRCGGAVLAWIIEGAKRFIDANYIVEPPESVKSAIAEYRNDNDQIAGFLEDCCEVGKEYSEKAGALYDTYRHFCERTGEHYIRNKLDFKTALISAGCDWKKTKVGAMYYGVQLNLHCAAMRFERR